MKSERINILLVASVILTALCAIITHYAIQASRERVRWAFQTQATISQAELLLSLAKDAETAQRGFIITEDSAYLTPLTNATQLLPSVIDSLQSLLENQPNEQEQNTLSNEIIPLINRRVARLNETLQLYKTKGKEASIANIKTDRGKATMDSARAKIAFFIQQENNSLKGKLDEMNDTHSYQNLVRFVSFAIIGCVSILAIIVLIRYQKKLDKLITKLNDTNNTLEKKVAERTNELSKKNQINEELNAALKESLEEIESFYESLQMRFTESEMAAQEIRTLYDTPVCGHHSLDETGLVIRMNKTELDWLGYTRDEVINKMNITELIHPSQHLSYQEDFALFKKTGFISNKQHIYVRKDGSTFPVLINASLIYDTSGNYKMSRATVVDLTSQKKTEEQLMEVNKTLQHLNDEKNRFLSIAAHDMKSPLNGILGLINLIRLDNSNLKPEQHEYIEYIERSCTNMQHVITNLLDISRIEQGEHKLTPELIEITALLKRHVQVFTEQAQKKNITLILEDNYPETKIFKDPSALERILENLISNAIKFSPNDKAVTLRVIHTKTHVGFEVIDQGQGISKEEMGNMFKKFHRLSARPTGGESSTGLGLSIVKELVNVLHGHIYVESELDKGSRFVVTFTHDKALV